MPLGRGPPLELVSGNPDSPPPRDFAFTLVQDRAWFVLDLSTGRTWLTDYAPQDIESLDQAAVAAMGHRGELQSRRCYIWVNLANGEIESRCITGQPLQETDAEYFHEVQGEMEGPAPVRGLL